MKPFLVRHEETGELFILINSTERLVGGESETVYLAIKRRRSSQHPFFYITDAELLNNYTFVNFVE